MFFVDDDDDDGASHWSFLLGAWTRSTSNSVDWKYQSQYLLRRWLLTRKRNLGDICLWVRSTATQIRQLSRDDWMKIFLCATWSRLSQTYFAGVAEGDDLLLALTSPHIHLERSSSEASDNRSDRTRDFSGFVSTLKMTLEDDWWLYRSSQARVTRVYR